MKFRDLGEQYSHLRQEIDAGIQEIIESSEFIHGKKVAVLEDGLADYVGKKHCVTCANGTDALQLVLMAWGIGPGDAVFTSDFTFFASAGTVSILGATPVFVDIDRRTFNIDPDALEKEIRKVLSEGRLTPRIIVSVDLFGQPANYPRIQAIAEKYSLKVLEDGAQGFGGSIHGKLVCSFGDAATTSFFPAKPLGCYGDGGAIFTDDDDLCETLRSLRAQGRSPDDKYDNRCIGMNSRLDTLQAAILLPKFEAFKRYELAAVNKVAQWYNERLEGKVTTPYVSDGFYSSWAQYTIMLGSRKERDCAQKDLRAQGIPSMIYYPRGLHQQTAYRDMLLTDQEYPNTVYATEHVLSLPMHPYLTQEQVHEVAAALLR